MKEGLIWDEERGKRLKEKNLIKKEILYEKKWVRKYFLHCIKND